MLKANSCVLSCLPQGMRVWKEREDSGDCIGQKLRVKDKRLFLRAIQINDKAKGYNPLTDRPPSPELSFPDPFFSRAVQWGQTLRISELGFPQA